MNPSDTRTDKQKDVDDLVRERVLRGIEMLKTEYGEDFADHIDLATLDLSDGEFCVLGQLYDDSEPTDDQWDALWAIPRYAHGDTAGGYLAGLAIIDGDVSRDPIAFGFEAGADGDWSMLTDIWNEELEGLRS